MSRIIEDYGYTEFFREQVQNGNMYDKELVPARVIAVHRNQYSIVALQGESDAKLKSSLFFNGESSKTYPCVGDFVLVEQNPYGEDIIYKVLERKSKFSRMDSFREEEQIVATNFDYVFIMTSLNHDFNIKRMDRYLTAAYQSGGTPIIVLTKSDLCKDYSYYEKMLDTVAKGVPRYPVSSFTGEGLDKLIDYIKPSKTIVFLGSSGVGKSSLVNAIAGEEVMEVNDIREGDSKGRHTTTHRQLFMIENGAMIIDTPGMRELGMWDVEDGLHTAFHDIEEITSRCKFHDCNHKSEPDCGIKEALESGELNLERWKNYKKLKKEIKFAVDKENMRLKEKSRRKNKSIQHKDF